MSSEQFRVESDDHRAEPDDDEDFGESGAAVADDVALLGRAALQDRRHECAKYQRAPKIPLLKIKKTQVKDSLFFSKLLLRCHHYSFLMNKQNSNLKSK